LVVVAPGLSHPSPVLAHPAENKIKSDATNRETIVANHIPSSVS
jgi:hypothetical protein